MNFEEEIKKFTPSMEINDAEEDIYKRDMTDVMDILQELMEEERSWRR